MVLAYAQQTFRKSHLHTLYSSGCAQLCETTSEEWDHCFSARYSKHLALQVGETQLYKSQSLPLSLSLHLWSS